MWTKEVPKEVGYYWVKAKGDLSDREYIHPVHLYKSNKDQAVPDRVFSDGENFSTSHSLFEWWPVRIKEPEGRD